MPPARWQLTSELVWYYFKYTGSPVTKIFPFLSSSIIILMVTFSSSKVTINISCSLFSCFFTPSICFRIEPILALDFQAEQPGTFNCTTLSLASTTLPQHNKMQVKNTPNIFFIFHLMPVLCLYNNSK